MIEIVNQKEDFKDEEILQEIAVFLDQMLEDFEGTEGGLDLVICDDPAIQKLNREYRGKDMPTDVLSFSQFEGEEMPEDEEDLSLGDIIISMDRAEAQAKEYGVTLREELARLSIHGALHLLGYDHETSEEDEEEMMAMQDEFLAKFLAE